MDKYQSWGGYPRAAEQKVVQVFWPDEVRGVLKAPGSYLPRGAGCSQGDVCLNSGGTLVDVQKLNRFIDWQPETGVLTVEPGVTLADVLRLTLPYGWFLPVTPGTKQVTVGGAIANDVHGKNHHRAGTFGCHVQEIKLLRSSGEELTCSAAENRELWQATIGGLGLTGIIVRAKIQLRRVVSQMICEEVIKMKSINDFFELAEESDARFDYTVAWLDCQTRGRQLGRGLFIRGNHDTNSGRLDEWRSWYRAKGRWPIRGPRGVISQWTVRAFNEFYYQQVIGAKKIKKVHFNKFFYPLDVVSHWNLVYGNGGFLQYQVVIPRDKSETVIKEIMRRVAASGRASFLSTLKYFGDIKSPGWLSFPRPGLVLAIDFVDASEGTRNLLDELDMIVDKNGGAVNPSKDSRMSPAMFKASFPNWQALEQYRDPKIDSSFWRRVTGVLK